MQQDYLRIYYKKHKAESWQHNVSDLTAGLKEKIDSFEIDVDSNPILVFYREK